MYGKNAYGFYMHRTGDQHGLLGVDGNSTYVGIHNSYHHSGWRYAHYDGDSNWDFRSDIRDKKDVTDAESMLDRVMDIKVRRFRWKDDGPEADLDLGVIAQEVESLFPELVGEFEAESQIPSVPLKQATEPYKTVGYTSFGIIAIKALQELKIEKDNEIAELRRQVADRDQQLKAFESQESKIKDLEDLVNSLVEKLNNQ